MSRALPLVLAVAGLVLVVAAAWASPSLLSPSAAVPDPVVLATGGGAGPEPVPEAGATPIGPAPAGAGPDHPDPSDRGVRRL